MFRFSGVRRSYRELEADSPAVIIFNSVLYQEYRPLTPKPACGLITPDNSF